MSSYYCNVFSVLLYESSFITKLLLNSLAYSHPCQVRPSHHICSMSGIDIMSFITILSINISIFLSFLIIHLSIIKLFSIHGLSHNYCQIRLSNSNELAIIMGHAVPACLIVYQPVYCSIYQYFFFKSMWKKWGFNAGMCFSMLNLLLIIVQEVTLIK